MAFSKRKKWNFKSKLLGRSFETDHRLRAAVHAQKVEIALRKIKIHGMSVSDIRGFGQQKDPSFPHYSSNLVHEFVPKVQLEIFCPDEREDEIVQTRYENGRTGKIGDGKILVLPVE